MSEVELLVVGRSSCLALIGLFFIILVFGRRRRRRDTEEEEEMPISDVPDDEV